MPFKKELPAIYLDNKNSTLLDASHAVSIHMHPAPNLSTIFGNLTKSKSNFQQNITFCLNRAFYVTQICQTTVAVSLYLMRPEHLSADTSALAWPDKNLTAKWVLNTANCTVRELILKDSNENNWFGFFLVEGNMGEVNLMSKWGAQSHQVVLCCNFIIMSNFELCCEWYSFYFTHHVLHCQLCFSFWKQTKTFSQKLHQK